MYMVKQLSMFCREMIITFIFKIRKEFAILRYAIIVARKNNS